MNLISIKCFEGSNIKRQKKIMRLIFTEILPEEISGFANLYIDLCLQLGIRVDIVDLKELGEEVQLWVSYSDEELAYLLWDSIIKNEYSREEMLERARQIYNKSLCEELITAADRLDLPLISKGRGIFQLGYGKNSVVVDCNHDLSMGVDSFLEGLRVSTKGNIPIFSVTGTNGKTTTSRLIYNILLKLGFCTGIACTGEIKIGIETVEKGDTTGFLSARRVLTDNRVEAAVLETARGGILRNGLGYEKVKAAIITSLSEDHFGMDGINSLQDLIKIKAVILEEICKDGKWVLKAQENIIEEARKIADQRKKEGFEERRFEEIASLVSTDHTDMIEKHIKAGGESYFMEDSFIIRCKGEKMDRLVSVKEIPFTYGGLSKANILNVMFAISAISIIEKDTKKLVTLIKNIPCDIEYNPGRQNILNLGQIKVLIDYGHNAEAYEFIYSMVRELNPSRVTSVITVAGDRTDSHIKGLGYRAGMESERIIIREQADRRGSSKGRVAGLLEEGALEAGVHESSIIFIEDAGEALSYALEEAVEGEVIVMFAEEHESVLRTLSEMSFTPL
jgi:UDP-N-acetylmuramyl tripeptide synthase